MLRETSFKIGEMEEPETILPMTLMDFLEGDVRPGAKGLSFIFAPQNLASHWLSGQAPPLPVGGLHFLCEGSVLFGNSLFPFFLSGCLSWWCDPPLKGVWRLPDTHVCFKIYIFDFLAHFLTADIKENCKCLEKSKFFLDTCSSTKFVFTTNSCKEEADGMSWKYLVIFLLKFSKPYFLSLLE